MITIREVTTIRKYGGYLLVQGTDHEGKTVNCTVYSEDVENLWFSIQRSQRSEKLRTLRAARLERMRHGRLC